MKWLVIVLLTGNGVVWAWWQGHLTPLWEPPGAGEREPFRSLRQLRPEAVQLVPARAASAGQGPGAVGSAPEAAVSSDDAKASVARR